MKIKEASVKELKKEVNLGNYNFKTTKDIEPIKCTIGQERAIKALKFGLDIASMGYNIYISGKVGTGRTTTIKRFLDGLVEKQKVSSDWCYVNNFSNPDNPIAIELPAGEAKTFDNDINDLITQIEKKIPETFESKDFEDQNNDLIRNTQDLRNDALQKLKEYAEGLGFTIKISPTGITALPMLNDQPLSKEEFDKLSEEEQKDIQRRREDIQEKINETIATFRQIEKDKNENIKCLHKEMTLFTVGPFFDKLLKKYADHKKIKKFLKTIKEDIIVNIEQIMEYEQAAEEQKVQMWKDKKFSGPFEKYRINVFVDNSEVEGAPVIFENNPTYYNMFGSIEYESHYGSIITNYKHIKTGSIQKANGGYLVVPAEEVLMNPFVWSTLKRALRCGEIRCENMGAQYTTLPTVSLKPEQIPLKVKVIMTGSPYIYHLLYEYDHHFRKLFKVKADFDTVMQNTKKHITSYIKFINYQVEKNNLKHFTKAAVAKIIEYGITITEHKKKLSTEFIKISDLINEASFWATQNHHRYVKPEDVKAAIKKKHERSKLPEEKIQEFIEEGTILIDTDGAAVGQVNGLSIYDLGDYMFGKPTRITAQTYVGKSGVVNIEREIDMSGPSHSKGVLILSGYLSGKFAQDKPLALSATICFEQQYGGVDGDSASSTELYAILSSLSDLPIKQGLAVTGSVNQHGKIQPIGGVNKKIEGFYKVCKAKGLTGDQGVLIPIQNLKNLILDNEIIQAVADGKFHIYPVKTVEEGIEILTGTPAGERQDDGSFKDDTVFGRVDNRLQEMAEEIKSFAKPGNDKEETSDK